MDLCSKNVDDDSDIEIIESTPESLSKKSLNFKIANFTQSPEIVPPTPGCDSSIIENVNFSLKLNPKPKKLNFETNETLLTNSKEHLGGVKLVAKRNAETRTGVSPISKRNYKEKDIEKPLLCKINILNRMKQPKNSIDENDFAINTGKNLYNNNNSFEKENLKDSSNEALLINKIDDIEDSGNIFQTNLELHKTSDKNLSIKNSFQLMTHTGNKIEKDNFDDSLSIDFDKLSPFKEAGQHSLPKLSQNK